MSVLEAPRVGEPRAGERYPRAVNVGPIGRLGRFTATHFRAVLAAWVVLTLALGFFAPPR